MTRINTIKTTLASLLIVIGVLFGVLPKDWVEETVSVEPDAGNGALELAFVLLPIAIGGALPASVYYTPRRQVVGRADTPQR